MISSWTDAVSDAPWSSPDPGAALAALDRFHPIPDVPERSESWAEWLYFNGHAGDNRFYLTFLVGPKRAGGKRTAGVRLQLDRAGQRSSYSQRQEVNEADVLSSAPNLTIGSNRVRLDGMRYQITLDLPAENRTSRVTGDIIIEASPGRALPPLTIRGAGGWVSGYVVPVMSGRLSGTLNAMEIRLFSTMAPVITITTGDSGRMCRGDGARFIMAISRSCMAAFIRRRMRRTLNAFLDFSPRSDPMARWDTQRTCRSKKPTTRPRDIRAVSR